jgi:hypothetical protein
MRMKFHAVGVVLVVVFALALFYLTTASHGAGNAAPARPATSVLDQEVIPRTPERLARGNYLVNGALLCFGCHSQVDFSQRPFRTFGGTMGGGFEFPAEEMQLPPGNRIVAPNISPDPDYGAGKWKDSDFVRALRQGIGHDGRTLFPMMPYEYLRNLSDEDLASVIVYIRSIPPVHMERPKTILTPVVKQMFKPLPPVEHVPEPDQSNRLRYGQYLVTVAHCEGCHTPADERTQQPLPGMNFAGGEALVGYWGPDTTKLITVNSLNLTPHPSGISYMDEALFIKALRTGQVQARQLSNIMPWSMFRNLTDDDLKAIYAYLRTVKPVQHRVDNTEPPGYCPRCRHKHGFGTRN